MEEIQKASMAQKGLAQFEKLHSPVEVSEQSPSIMCITCEEDWPCERMSIVLISQSISVLTSMLPSGNLSSVLSRFAASQQSQ